MNNNLQIMVWVVVQLALGWIPLQAQETRISDTLYANDQNQVALFFPFPIRQAITGNSQAIFTYNKDRLQHFGLLQALEGTETNLLVIDQQNLIYSYYVKYKTQLPQYLHFFRSKDAVGSAIPLDQKRDSLPAMEGGANWKSVAEGFLKSTNGRLRSSQKAGIVLRISSMILHEERFFCILEIENKSAISYQPDRLFVSRMTRKQGKRKSFQNIPLKILETYSFPDTVAAGDTKRFIIILPKFTIPSNYKLQLSLFEKNGSREVRLNLYPRHFKKVLPQ